ncbi:3-phosphoshikimate 1-carboxyvinyltransferase [Streptomyces sp. NPDC021098]|uniref:3-phosphoshikimate 1-carboxyvinyltransferase n=1 Tax=unclassified Streptomyces TaxID=2593676 RepID=UPI0037A2C2D6
MRLLVKRLSEQVSGQLIVPASKYHAHRALILASLAPGVSRIAGLSDAGHVRHTLAALRSLGTRIDVDGDAFVVHGGPYRPRRTEISVGSSGTTLYFLAGLSCLAETPVTVVGQKYFQRRPIGPLLRALSDLGIDLDSPTGCPPISVRPRRPKGGHVRIQGTLSQWISGLLLVAPFATGPSTITVEGEFNERSYVDLTVRMMKQFGLYVDVSEDGRRFDIAPDQQPGPATVVLPPDIGSAAFGLAAAALHPADVLFRGLPAIPAHEVDHPEADVLKIFADMGLPMTPDPETGMVRVRHEGTRLNPVRVDCRSVPDMLPVLSVLGSVADGTTVFDNIGHVRLKESDRVAAMTQLNRMGARLEQRGEQLLCHGVDRLTGADLSSYNDHRVLMSLAAAGTVADGETRLTYPNAYRISYPRFLDDMNGIGLGLSVEKTRKTSSTPSPAPSSPAGFTEPARAATVPIGDHLRRCADTRPDEPAVFDPGTDGGRGLSWTWRELDEQVDRVATLLLDLGVRPGEPVAYQLPNQAEFVALALAVARIGAVSCPLMPMLRQRETAFMLRRARARVLVVPSSFRGRDYPAEVAELLRVDDPPALEHVLVIGGNTTPPTTTGPTWHDFADAVRRAPDRDRLDARRPEPAAPAQLLFTSGTSGEPKGVLHRMDALTRAAAMEIHHLGLTGEDRVFVPSPLAHQTGFLYGMWLAVLRGVPLILQPVWDGKTALGLLRQHGGTFVQAATPFLGDLVEAVEEAGEPPTSLRIFVATGAAVPRALAERATEVLGTSVCGAWGTTETCLGSLSAPGDEPAKMWGTDGRALDGIRLRVTDDTGAVLPAGQEGNFEVSGPCMFLGYYDRPEWTAEATTPDGWFRSGDLAVIDESGYVRISGRVKDVVNRGGEKVPVGEIEQLLHTHPAVRDVAIVAMPDPRLGERACAYVVAGEEFDFQEMRRFLDERQVAKPYWPERLVRVDRLPRNPAGKVQKFLLREDIQKLMRSGA